MPGIEFVLSLENDPFIRSANAILNSVRNMAAQVEKMGGDMQNVMDGIFDGKNLGKGMQSFFDVVIEKFGLSERAAESFRQRATEAIQTIASTGDDAALKISKIITALSQIASSEKQIDSGAGKLGRNLQEYYDGFATELEGLEKIIKEAESEFSKVNTEGLDQTQRENALNLFKEIGNAIRENITLAKGQSQAYQEMGRSLEQGLKITAVDELGKSFSLFGKVSQEDLEDGVKHARSLMEELTSLRENIGSVIDGVSSADPVVDKLLARVDIIMERLKGVESTADLVQPWSGMIDANYERSIKDLADIEEALIRIRDGHQEAEQTANKVAEAHESIRVQIRKTREEIDSLIDAGKEGTPEFTEAVNKASELKENMAKINLLMDYNSRGGSLKALKDGLQGIAGVGSLATGVIGLFNRDTEAMAAIQTKIQSLLAVTVGLQESYSFAIKASTIAQTLFNKVANMNPYVRIASLLGIAIGAITLYTTRTKELSKAEQERIEREKELHDAAVQGEKDSVAERVNLKLLYDRATDETKSKEERLKAVNAIRSAYPGYFSELTDEAILVGQASDKYNQLTNDILAAAQARAYQKKIEELTSQNIDLQDSIDKNKQFQKENRREYNKSVRNSVIQNQTQAFSFNTTGTSYPSLKTPGVNRDLIGKWNEATEGIKNNTKAIEANNAQIDKYTQKINETIGAQDRLKNNTENHPVLGPKGGGGSRGGTAVDKTLEEQKRALETLRKMEEENAESIADMTISLMEDGFDKSVAELKRNYDKSITELEDRISEYKDNVAKAGKDLADPEVAKGLELFGTQRKQIEQQYNQDYQKILNDRNAAEREAMTNYLKEFGTAEEQRLAIAHEYDEKIAKAQTAGERLALAGQKNQVLSQHDKQQAERAMNLEDIFNDLENLSLEKLNEAKELLRGMFDTKELGIDEYKTVAERIDKINDAIVEKRKQEKGLLGALIPDETTVARLRREQAEALRQQEDAAKAVAEAQATVATKTANLKAILRGNGVYGGDVNTSKANAILSAAEKAWGKGSPLYKEVEKGLFELAGAERDAKNATENKGEADKNVESRSIKLGEALSNVRQRVGEFANSLQTINANIQALPDLMDSLGLGDTKAGQKVGQVASAASNAMGAMSDFASGNYIGAASKAINTMKDLSNVIGIGADNTAKMQKKIDDLNAHSDALAKAMSSLEKAFNNSYGIDAMNKAEDIQKLQEQRMRDYQNAMIAEGNKHGTWRSSLHSSVEDNSGWKEAMRQVSQLLGVTVKSSKDFLSLTAEQMQKIIELNNGELWAKILREYRVEGGSGGRSDQLANMLNEYVDEFGTAFEEIANNLSEKLTLTTKDNVLENFKNSLYDLADGSEEVMDNIATNWQQMINRMVINNLILKDFQGDIKKWYDDLAKVQEERNTGIITTDEEYQRKLEELRTQYENLVTGAQGQMKNFQEMGIIKTIDDAADKTTEDTLEYLDTIRSAFEQLVSDSETDMEAWGNNLRNSILQNLIQSKLLDEEFDKWSNGWAERYSKLMSDLTDGVISQTDYDRQLAELNAEFDKTTGEISEKSKQMWEAFGIDAEEAKDETKSAFEDLHSSFLSTLTDINGDVEAWSKNITKTMVEQLVERNILNDAFDQQMDAWRESFESALEANDTEGLIALRKELEDLRGSLAKQAQEYMNALGYVQDVVNDTTFKDMGGDFRSQLMNLDATAEDWAESVGRKMAEKIVDEMVSSTMIQPFLDELQKAFNAAMSVEGATVSSVLTALTPQIEAAKQAFEQAQPVVHDILAQLGITEKQELPFSDLRSTFVNTLMDMEADAETFGKEIGRTLIEQMIDTQLKNQFQNKLDELNNEWAKALQNGDSAAIENIRQQMVQMREDAARAVQPLLDDLKELEYVAEDTPLSGLRSSFLSDLMDMESSTEDFADNINKILTEAFVDKFVLGEGFDKMLNEWQERYRQIMDSDISESDRAAQLLDLKRVIGDARDNYTEQARAIQELMGITDTSALADQEAHVNMADKATYDQFELYLGIATAQQIALEQGNDVRKQILSTLQMMGGIASPNGNTVMEIRSMLRTTNEHLYAVKIATEGIRAEFLPRLQSIDNKLSKL